jgi:hypothetical protein
MITDNYLIDSDLFQFKNLIGDTKMKAQCDIKA